MAYTFVLTCTHMDTLGTKKITIVLGSRTWVHLQLAVRPRPARAACAFVGIDEVCARSAVHAGRRPTLVRVNLTIVPAVSPRAHAAVRKCVVKARGAVKARRRRAFI